MVAVVVAAVTTAGADKNQQKADAGVAQKEVMTEAGVEAAVAVATAAAAAAAPVAAAAAAAVVEVVAVVASEMAVMAAMAMVIAGRG